MSVGRRDSSPFALAALLAANLLPLAGVVWFGWSVFEVLLVYWLESGVIGLLNVPKILLATGSGSTNVTFRINGRPLDVSPPDDVDPDAGPRLYLANLGAAGFFCVHYGIFWVVHGVFVLYALPGYAGVSPGADLAAVALGGVAMAASHGGSLVWNFVGRDEYRDVSPGQQMAQPYRRVVVLHLTIVLGAFAVASSGSPFVLVTLLVVLKVGFDVVAHLREHRRAAVRRGEDDRRVSGPAN
jgi:hypothetical protein